jgi:CubicO group peptidase (beta-lactamase class C family)
VVVLVADREGVLFEAAEGVRNVPESGTDASSNRDPVSTGSLFWLASQTKLVTSIAATQLIERGVWTLESDASQFVPELKSLRILTGISETGEEQFEDRKGTITIRNLCTHTAGTVFPFASPAHEQYRLKHGLERVWEGPLAPKVSPPA